MKKFIVILSVLLMLSAGVFLFTAFKSPTPPTAEYSFGSRTTLSPTYAATVAIELTNTLTVIDVTTAGNMTVNLASTSKLIIGDRAVFVVKATGAAKDTITWGTNLTAPIGIIDTAKYKTFEFIYDGTDFKGVGTPFHLSWYDSECIPGNCSSFDHLLAIQSNSNLNWYWANSSYRQNSHSDNSNLTKINSLELIHGVTYHLLPLKVPNHQA